MTRFEAYDDAFGQASVRQGQMPSVHGFGGAAGYQTDGDTGLMLLGSRYYDASVGRFITPDPAQDGDNWYAYCGNNPLGYVDPTGLTMQGAAPTGSDFGSPMAEMGEAEQAHAQDYYSGLYLNSYTDTKTYVGKKLVNDTGPQLDWSIPLGNNYSDYFQLVGAGDKVKNAYEQARITNIKRFFAAAGGVFTFYQWLNVFQALGLAKHEAAAYGNMSSSYQKSYYKYTDDTNAGPVADENLEFQKNLLEEQHRSSMKGMLGFLKEFMHFTEP